MFALIIFLATLATAQNSIQISEYPDILIYQCTFAHRTKPKRHRIMLRGTPQRKINNLTKIALKLNHINQTLRYLMKHTIQCTQFKNGVLINQDGCIAYKDDHVSHIACNGEIARDVCCKQMHINTTHIISVSNANDTTIDTQIPTLTSGTYQPVGGDTHNQQQIEDFNQQRFYKMMILTLIILAMLIITSTIRKYTRKLNTRARRNTHELIIL